MLADLNTVIWKEAKLLGAGAGGRGRWLPLIMVGFFGVVMPLQLGSRWISSPLGVLFSVMIPLILVASWAADTFAGERERHTLETLLATRLSDRAILFGKIVTITVAAWLLGIATLVAGVVTVNLTHPSGTLDIYPADIMVSSVALSLLFALMAAAAGVLISLRASSVRQVQQIVSIGILVVVWVPILVVNALPAPLQQSLQSFLTTASTPVVALVVGGALAVIDAILLAAAMARFQRARLTFT